jgi:hypothetical protein
MGRYGSSAEEKPKKPKKPYKKEGKSDGGFAASAAPKKVYDKDGPKGKPAFEKGKAKPKEAPKEPKAPKEKPNAATIQVRKPTFYSVRCRAKELRLAVSTTHLRASGFAVYTLHLHSLRWYLLPAPTRDGFNWL